MFSPLLVTGCGTMKNGRCWGQDAIYPVNFKRVRCAAHNAFFDIQTLLPIAGALVFAADDWDEKTSEWATKHNPVFGSEDSAKDASDYLKTTLMAETLLTAFATPSDNDTKEWGYSNAKVMTVEVVAWGASRGSTVLLKHATGRSRPDDSDDNSFPSGHSSSAFTYATLSNRNLDQIDIPKKFKRTLQVGNLFLATGVAWARVEGDRHYPSDVLAGAALGHFLSAFIHDAFLGLPEDKKFDFAIFAYKNGAMARVLFAF